MKKLIVIFLLTISCISRANVGDSLYNIWTNSSAIDTQRVIALDRYLGHVWNRSVKISPDSALKLSQELEKYSKRIDFKKGIVKAYNNQIISYALLGNIDKAIAQSEKSQKLSISLNYEKGEESAYYSLGVAYYFQNNFEKAIENYGRALALQIRYGNLEGVISSNVNLGTVYYNLGDYYDALRYYEKALELSKGKKNYSEVSKIYNNTGLIYRELGDFPKSLDYLIKSLETNEMAGNKTQIASSLHNIGLIYLQINENDLALEYFNRSLGLEKQSMNKRGIATTLNSIADVLTTQKNYSYALVEYNKSYNISEKLKDENAKAISLSGIANIYSIRGHYIKADELYQKILKILSELGVKKEIAYTYQIIGFNYLDQNKFTEAIVSCKKALELSEIIESLDIQKESCDCLYKAYKSKGQNVKALEYFEKMTLVNDSIKLKQVGRELLQMEFEKKMVVDSLDQEKEKLTTKLDFEEKLGAENQKRNIAIGAGIFLLLIVGGLYSRVKYIRKSNKIIESERDRSDDLLHNILPVEVARELKQSGKSEARNYEKVTVIFTDFKEFTQAAEKLSPKELIQEINSCFEKFDSICDKYNLEKIKTIGDSYMAAGGLLIKEGDTVRDSVLAGIEMKDYILERKEQRLSEQKVPFEMRVGIHTGSVIAGIVGTKKFQYDLWGDAVNTASRMESSGTEGYVNISHNTYIYIKDNNDFSFEYRGKVKAKGKGEVDMYYVHKIENTV